MTAEDQKRAVAAAAVAWVEPQLRGDLVLGIGTGSTADHFIDLLAPHRGRFAGAVASSSRTAARLAGLSVTVFALNDVGELPIYVDGADEINAALEMVKGGGGALTREKIVAAASAVFVCIADSSKRVTTLGDFPLPIEVIPMARAQVIRALEAMGRAEGLGDPTFSVRAAAGGQDLVTDNGNIIVDVRGWSVRNPRRIESAIGAIVGVVESGLFALRPADVLLVSSATGVDSFERPR